MPAAFPLRRDLDGLRAPDAGFDLLVIGGGIYGAWCAYDAALRGLKVALVERKDWGCGTSQSSSKLIHGGLRYLEHFEFKLVSHALAERRVLAGIAPHLVQPLNFLVPVWKGARVGRLQLLAGLTLYDFLATGKQPVPRYKSFGADALRHAHPYLRDSGLKGGLRYGDCQEDDARMTLAVVAAAQARGAVCATGVAAEALLVAGGRVAGARLVADDGSEAFELRAAVTVNAAGPWAAQLVRDAFPTTGAPRSAQAALPDADAAAVPKVKLVRGIHLVLPPVPGLTDAFLLTAPQDGRVFFVIPWYGRTLLGTTEAQIGEPSQASVVADEERDYLLVAVAALLPGLVWTADDVIASFAGARTLQAEDADSLSAQTREFVITEPAPGLLWPIGGKYTTARCDAALVIDRVGALLPRPERRRADAGAPGNAPDRRTGKSGSDGTSGRRSANPEGFGGNGAALPASLTHRYPLPGAPVGTREGSVMLGDFTGWQAEAVAGLVRQGIDPDAAAQLTRRHGTRVSRIHALLAEDPKLAARLVPDLGFVEAEVVLAVRDEGARSFEDVARRRLPLTLLAKPGPWEARVRALMARA